QVSFQMQNPRLEPAAAGRVALLQVEREGLYQDAFLREVPAVLGHVVDLTVAGHGDEPLFVRAVGPQRRVDGVGYQSGRRAMLRRRSEQAGLRKLARKRRRRMVGIGGGSAE